MDKVTTDTIVNRRKITDATRKKLSIAAKGRTHTPETRKKMSANMKGRTAWNKGMKMSDEFRRKCSIAHTTTGAALMYKLSRKSVDYKRWRKVVFVRDKYTCRRCFKKGGKLHSHHIVSFSDYPEFRFDSDNGITLCEKCHKEFHKLYGLKKFRSEAIIVFLYK